MRKNSFNIEQVRAHWDTVAHEYDSINSKFDWTHTERFTTMQKFLPIKQGASILNVWSRTGKAIPYIREYYPQADILNLEAAENMIAPART